MSGFFFSNFIEHFGGSIESIAKDYGKNKVHEAPAGNSGNFLYSL